MRRYGTVIGLLTMVLAGCGQDETSSSPSSLPSAKSQAVSVSATTLDLRSENPPTTGCLQAVVKGTPPKEGVRWLVNGQPLTGETGSKLCRDVIRRGDEVTVQMPTGGQTLSRSLRVANAPPRVMEINISVDPGKVMASATTEDADGDSVDLRYQWLINGEESEFLSAASVPRSDLQPTDKLQVRITPNDGTEDGPVYASRIFSQPNLPPRIVSTPPPKFETLEYTYQVKANDPDRDKLTFSLEAPPKGMLVNKGTGKITWPLTGVAPGKYVVKIVVRDPAGGEDRQEFELTLGEAGGG